MKPEDLLLLVTRDPERVAPTARELAARYGIRADVLLADLGTRHGLFRLEAFLAGPEAPAVDVLVHDALADARHNLRRWEVIAETLATGAAPR